MTERKSTPRQWILSSEKGDGELIVQLPAKLTDFGVEQLESLFGLIMRQLKRPRVAADEVNFEAKPAPKPEVKATKKQVVIFVINGEEIPIDVGHDETLGAARSNALRVSHNTGRPENEWEMRTENGVRLNPDAAVGSTGLADRDLLFLSLRVGLGGDASPEVATAPEGAGRG